MEEIPAEDYFSDALHYRAHDNAPYAVLPLKKDSERPDSLGVWIAFGAALVTGYTYELGDFEHIGKRKRQAIAVNRGDAIFNTIGRDAGGFPVRECIIIPKAVLNKKYELVRNNYRLKPYKKKLATKDFRLVSKNVVGIECVDIIRSGSDLVWREGAMRGSGTYEYEQHPLCPGFNVPLIDGKPIHDGLWDVFQRVGLENKAPILNTQIAMHPIRTAYGGIENPYKRLMDNFSAARSRIDEHRPALNIDPAYEQQLEAHIEDIVERYDMYQRRRQNLELYA